MLQSTLPPLTLVIGGANSGKSAYAEELILAAGGDPVYIATAQAFDAEMATKIERHKARRAGKWRTLEAPFDPISSLAGVTKTDLILLDCVTLWLSNHLLAGGDLNKETDRLLSALARCAAPIVVVTNEVGMSVVPESSLGRRFRALQGGLNQRIAATADRVVLVTAGLPQTLKSPQ